MPHYDYYVVNEKNEAGHIAETLNHWGGRGYRLVSIRETTSPRQVQLIFELIKEKKTK